MYFSAKRALFKQSDRIHCGEPAADQDGIAIV